eukprot:4036487-Prymnesium_polylepis.1
MGEDRTTRRARRSTKQPAFAAQASSSFEMMRDADGVVLYCRRGGVRQPRLAPWRSADRVSFPHYSQSPGFGLVR